ncbi:hypothetical protein [Jeotgalibacillus terrae]|uniref:Flagellar hook-length control protein-like C-terminal domain-containing protein n=1 Tax=Jeotgalibacillus terrae TaxID=587735 RepID=A0ABW5ZD74_9BACL|nr:hypothetical protein [Jeotgalibacillus terrae]MBM7577758.1 putative amino acid-binding ACT domain protein [Jeotgalibacillus terrae]
MQIKMDPAVSSQSGSQKEVALKQGDLFSANVKSKGNGEATLQVKGQEVKVKTEGELPANGRVSLEVTGTKDGMPVVRQVQQNPQQSQQQPDLVKLNDGKPLTPELKVAVNHLMEKGVPVNKEVMQALRNFLSKTDAPSSQKLETIQAAVSKNLSITANKLTAIHSALHGPPISEAVSALLKSAGVEITAGRQHSTSQIESAARQQLTQALQLLMKAAPEQVQSLLKQFDAGGNVKELAAQLQKNFPALLANNQQATKFLDNAVKLDSLVKPVVESQPVDQSKALMIQEAKTSIRKSPDVKAVVESFAKLSDQADFDPQTKQALQQSAAKAEQFIQNGQELQARQEMMQGIQQASAAYPLKAASEQYQLSDELISQIPMQSRDVIVTRISERLSQAALDFKNIQKDISRNLSQIEFAANQPKQAAVQQTKPLLEATIKMLDQAILKGDFMLHTNMQTEKNLLKASGQLAEASKLLARGEVAQAARITSEVKSMMEKIEFKPSDVKVQHFVSKEIMQLEPASQQRTTAMQLQQSMQMLHNEPSARHAYEHVRSMGMTFENEQAHSLLRGSGNEQMASTLKAMLLKMSQEGKADQSMNQLIGQQLLSKTDTNGLQSMVMTLPFILQEKVENFKVYMQSKNSSQKIDWENCNLYFLFDTKKMGEIGVSLNVSERNLSIKMKNDQEGFEAKMAPITDLAKDRLEQIGYQVQQLQFDRLTKEDQPEEAELQEKAVPIMTEKGYDFSV